MTKETLKWLRTFIPGILLIVIMILPFLLIYWNYEFIEFLYKWWIVLTVAALGFIYLFGSIYYIYNPRNFFFPKFLTLVNKNIKTRLYNAVSSNKKVIANKNILIDSRLLMNIFYNFIDNDESLKSRAHDIYFNGCLWSSFVDLAIFSYTSVFLYLILYITTKNYLFGICVICFAVIFVLSKYLVIPKTINNHINKSNDQLDYIENKYKKELLNDILDAIKNNS